jgi:hypothetical protein
MTKTEQNRVLAWRLKVLREASAAPWNVAQTCRHFGLSRKAFYKWKARYEAQGEAGLCDRPRVCNDHGVPAQVIGTRDSYVAGVNLGLLRPISAGHIFLDLCQRQSEQTQVLRSSSLIPPVPLVYHVVNIDNGINDRCFDSDDLAD